METRCSECGTDTSARRQAITCGAECARKRRNRLHQAKTGTGITRCVDCDAEFAYDPTQVGRRKLRCAPCQRVQTRKLNAAKFARWYAKQPAEYHSGRSDAANHPRPPEVRRSNTLWSLYGLTQADIDRMTMEQGGLCAICRLPPEGRGKHNMLVVDHCHVGGHNRSLLCGNCNIAIGLMSDDPAILEAAIEYLRRWASQPD